MALFMKEPDDKPSRVNGDTAETDIMMSSSLHLPRRRHGQSPPEPHCLLVELPEDMLCCVTDLLDAPSLLRMTCTNHFFHRLCHSDQAGWDTLCRVLWHNKAHVPPMLQSLTPRRCAYQATLQDAQQRNHVMLDELCYDARAMTGTIWSFRFKQSAGPAWTQRDPWWLHGEARRMVFLRNGRVKAYIQSHAAVALDDPSFGYLVDPHIPMTWRFLSRPMDMPTRTEGSYLRLTAGGRDVPTYSVRRSPTDNWGFLMESCWGVFTSFPMPLRRRVPEHRAASDTNVMMNVNDREEEEQEEDATDVDRYLRDDSTMEITNHLQWKEVLCYNSGATILPDGDDTTE